MSTIQEPGPVMLKTKVTLRSESEAVLECEVVSNDSDDVFHVVLTISGVEHVEKAIDGIMVSLEEIQDDPPAAAEKPYPGLDSTSETFKDDLRTAIWQRIEEQSKGGNDEPDKNESFTHVIDSERSEFEYFVRVVSKVAITDEKLTISVTKKQHRILDEGESTKE